MGKRKRETWKGRLKFKKMEYQCKEAKRLYRKSIVIRKVEARENTKRGYNLNYSTLPPHA